VPYGPDPGPNFHIVDGHTVPIHETPASPSTKPSKSVAPRAPAKPQPTRALSERPMPSRPHVTPPNPMAPGPGAFQADSGMAHAVVSASPAKGWLLISGVAVAAGALAYFLGRKPRELPARAGQ